jgi:hypothetical protein
MFLSLLALNARKSKPKAIFYNLQTSKSAMYHKFPVDLYVWRIMVRMGSEHPFRGPNLSCSTIAGVPKKAVTD